MPAVLRILGYRFSFYEADLDEPPHVHVAKDRKAAKYWITHIEMVKSKGFRKHELNEIEHILLEYHDYLLKAWQKEQSKRGNR